MMKGKRRRKGWLKFSTLCFGRSIGSRQRFVRVWEAGFTGLSNLYAALIHGVLKNIFTQLLAVAVAAVALAGGIYMVIISAASSASEPSTPAG